MNLDETLMTRLLPIFIFLASLLRAESGPLLFRSWQSSDGLPGNVVLAVAQTPDRFLWIATTEGLARFDGYEFAHILSPPDFLSQRLRFARIHALPNGEVWLTTTRGLLFKVDGSRLIRMPFPGGENEARRVDRIMQRRGVTYVRSGETIYAAGERGLAEAPDASPALREALAGQPFDHAASLPVFEALFAAHGFPALRKIPNMERGWSFTLSEEGNPIPVNDYCADAEGNLWLASTGQGLIRLKPRAVTYLDEAGIGNPPNARAALKARDGTWWFVNMNGGFDRLVSGSLIHHDLPASSSSVTGLHQDRNGGIWILAESGKVFRWDAEAGIVVPLEIPGLSKVHVIADDHSGHLLFGGAEGIFRYAHGSFTDLSAPAGLGNIRPTVIAPHSSGGLLIGTRDGRAILLGSGKFRYLGKLDDFSQSWVSGILEAPDGYIWASTLGSGLFQWKNEAWIRYSRETGLPDERLTSLHITENDEFWCGSLSGILRISRRELVGQKSTPARWQAYNQNDGMRTRECIGTSQPAYWRDGDGVASERPLLVPVTVRPHYWETTTFSVAVIITSLAIAVIIGGLFVRRRTRAKIAALKLNNALELERSRIARDLHDDLGANLTELSIIASLAAEGNGPAAPQEAFAKMADKARKVVIALDEIVWAVSPQEDTLPSLIEYLDAYGEEFIGNAGLAYRSTLPASVPSIPVGPRRRHHLCLATREALNNAVKHAAATEITLHATLENDHLSLLISDNGGGMDPHSATHGDGLRNLRERMDKCGGTCAFSPNPKGGTCVTLSIPLLPSTGIP